MGCSASRAGGEGTLLTEDNDITADIKFRIIMANETNYGFKKQPKLRIWNLRLSVGYVLLYSYKTDTDIFLLKEGWKYAQNLWKENIGMIYGPINDNDIWRTRYNNELYTLYDTLDTV
jgi:hypothetical protein